MACIDWNAKACAPSRMLPSLSATPLQRPQVAWQQHPRPPIMPPFLRERLLVLCFSDSSYRRGAPTTSWASSL